MNAKRFVAVAAVIAATGYSTTLAAAQPTHVSMPVLTQAAPASLFTEYFETGAAANDAPTLLTNYTGPAPLNMTYTADPSWLTDCNALIIDGITPANDQSGAGCNSSGGQSFPRGDAAATALGSLGGVSPSAGNHALLYYTEANSSENPTAPLLQTAKQIPIPATSHGHFLTFSIDVAGSTAMTNTPG